VGFLGKRRKTAFGEEKKWPMTLERKKVANTLKRFGRSVVGGRCLGVEREKGGVFRPKSTVEESRVRGSLRRKSPNSLLGGEILESVDLCKRQEVGQFLEGGKDWTRKRLGREAEGKIHRAAREGGKKKRKNSPKGEFGGQWSRFPSRRGEWSWGLWGNP